MVNQSNNEVEGHVDIPFMIEKREQNEYDLCLYLRSNIEGVMTVAAQGTKEKFNDALGICVYEFFENAIRYSKLGTTIRTSVKKIKSDFHVQVSNITDKEHGLKIIARVEEMNKHAPLEYYLSQMRRKPEEGEAGGLGMARVYHDSKAKISAELVDDPQGQKLIMSAKVPIAS